MKKIGDAQVPCNTPIIAPSVPNTPTNQIIKIEFVVSTNCEDCKL